MHGHEYVDTPKGRIELGHSEQLKHDDAYRDRGLSYMKSVGWGLEVEVNKKPIHPVYKSMAVDYPF